MHKPRPSRRSTVFSLLSTLLASVAQRTQDPPSRSGRLPAVGAWGGKMWRFCARSGLWVVAAFLAFMLWYAPFLDPRDFDYDEGLNLMKALLQMRGYSLYTEIWSDQPPLMTVLLAAWMRTFGTSVVTARLLILGLSCLLLTALYATIRVQASATAATFAIVLLVLSEEYVRLSTSVMIGLPALAFIVLALLLLVLAKKRRQTWLFAACGVIMALALQTKLIALVVAPAVVGYIILAPDVATLRATVFKRLWQLALWSIALTAAFLLMGVWFHALNVDMLLRTHLSDSTREAFWGAQNLAYLRDVFREHALYLLLAAAGIVWAVRCGKWDTIFLPLIWLLTATAALAYHKPIWHHHVTLLTIPLAWLCASGIDAWLALTRRFRQGQFVSHPLVRWRVIPMANLLVLLVGVLLYPDSVTFRIPNETYRFRPTYNLDAVTQLQADVAKAPGWVFTDRPYYAFQAGAAVPPPMAVLSRKRLESGQLTEATLLNVLDTYRPRYIILERFLPLYGPGLIDTTRQDYKMVFDNEQTQYYIIW